MEELERQLRNSEMAYSLKVNRYYKGVAYTPCNDCPFKKEDPCVSICDKTKDCFKRCPYEIVIWILSPSQTAEYEKLRPPDMKNKELERAINERKIVQAAEPVRG